MRLAIVTSCIIAMAIVGIVVYDRLPAQHSPLASFDPQRPVGMATGWQIGRLDGDRAACHAALDRAGLRTVARYGRHFNVTSGRTGPVGLLAKRGLDQLAIRRPALGPMIIVVATPR